MKNWQIEVWGDYACFTRPEMKVERVSYDVMTPSAARGILEAILWKPSIKWRIIRIDVIKPIRWTTVRRNEVGRLVSSPTQAHLDGANRSPLGFDIADHRQQRAGLILRDVHYVIHAYFDFLPYSKADGTSGQDESEAKYAAMFGRRARKGQCFHRPYLGCREFACYFRLLDESATLPAPIQENRDLGWMLYDMDFSNKDDPNPLFFRASLRSGSVNTDRRTIEVRG